MKREVTWGIVGTLAVAGIVGMSLPGTKPGKENSALGATKIGVKAHAKATANGASDSKRACDDLAETLEQFLGKQVPRPRSCFDEDTAYTNQPKPKIAKSEDQAPDPRFVVATLPDPMHTHLALMFDRMTEVIQQAAQDENYTYTASWLPWEDSEDSYLFLDDQDRSSHRADLREQQPGILVFRNSKPSKASSDSPFRDGLIVFIVGETPTGGIHSEQFTHAVQWIQDLQSLDGKRGRTVILGPTFSGSFPSLTALLSASLVPPPAPPQRIRGELPTPLTIYSGTANSGTAIADFEASANDVKSTNSGKPDIDFHGFLERDEIGLERYCTYLQKQSRGARLAILSEDQTAYGASSGGASSGNSPAPADKASLPQTSSGENDEKKDCLQKNDTFWLYYPRDIAALRAAYQTNAMFSATASQQSPEVSTGRLPTDLADPAGKDRDAIRSYAGNQTPLSQESYLLSVVNAMRVQHSQYVILRSTNPLDQLFLARYLRRAYPDARIVTDNSDLLFEREHGASEMGGTMSLSTYPLLEREQEWVEDRTAANKSEGGSQAQTSKSQRLFNSDTAEGTYIALRLLLHSDALRRDTDIACPLAPDAAPTDSASSTLPVLPEACRQLSPPLPDYGMPSWLVSPGCRQQGGSAGCTPRRPPTWLTVLGRDGYWAIAALNENTLQSGPPGKTNLSAKTDSSRQSPSPDVYRAETPRSLKILLLLVAVFVGFHCWCCWAASYTAKPSFRTHFADWGRWRHTALIFLGSLFAAAVPLFVGWGCGVFDPTADMPPPSSVVRLIVLLECAVALLAGPANIFRIAQLRKPSSEELQAKPQDFNPQKQMLIAFGASALAVVLFFTLHVLPLDRLFSPANRFFTYYRSMHMLSGVSPVVPLLVLTIGMYLWFWHALHGLALFGPDRCRLPLRADLRLRETEILRMFSQEDAAMGTEHVAKPLSRGVLILGSLLGLGSLLVVSALCSGLSLRTLGSNRYAIAVLLCLMVGLTLMAAETWQLLTTWSKLRKLLVFLDQTPLRRTLAALRGFSWGSVWGMSGNVLDVRYKLLSRQMESLGRTWMSLSALSAKETSSRVAARYCMAVLTKLTGSENNGDRAALAQTALDSLAKLRESVDRGLQTTLDAARDCIMAQRLDAANFDLTVSDSVQVCVAELRNFIEHDAQTAQAESECIAALADTRDQKGMAFIDWYAEHYTKPDAADFTRLEAFQKSAAKTAGILLTRLLLPEWRTETNSLILQLVPLSSEAEGEEHHAPPPSDKQHIRDAEEFVCLPYLGFVQNILGRMRCIVLGIVSLFVAIAVAIASYPFDPRQVLSAVLFVIFVLLGACILNVYAQMHRDATLSHVTNTRPGELGSAFWLKIVSLGAAPLLGLLTTMFPEISDFVLSWLQPGLQSIK